MRAWQLKHPRTVPVTVLPTGHLAGCHPGATAGPKERGYILHVTAVPPGVDYAQVMAHLARCLVHMTDGCYSVAWNRLNQTRIVTTGSPGDADPLTAQALRDAARDLEPPA